MGTWGKLEPRLPSSLQEMGYLWPSSFWLLSLFGEHFASSKLKFNEVSANPIKATVHSSPTIIIKNVAPSSSYKKRLKGRKVQQILLFLAPSLFYGDNPV